MKEYVDQKIIGYLKRADKLSEIFYDIPKTLMPPTVITDIALMLQQEDAKEKQVVEIAVCKDKIHVFRMMTHHDDIYRCVCGDFTVKAA